MLEDTNSLDGAQMCFFFFSYWWNKWKFNETWGVPSINYLNEHVLEAIWYFMSWISAGTLPEKLLKTSCQLDSGDVFVLWKKLFSAGIEIEQFEIMDCFMVKQ